MPGITTDERGAEGREGGREAGGRRSEADLERRGLAFPDLEAKRAALRCDLSADWVPRSWIVEKDENTDEIM